VRLPEDEHCDTAKAVDQLGRAPATASVRVREAGTAFWVLRGGCWVLFWLLLYWYADVDLFS